MVEFSSIVIILWLAAMYLQGAVASMIRIPPSDNRIYDAQQCDYLKSICNIKLQAGSQCVDPQSCASLVYKSQDQPIISADNQHMNPLWVLTGQMIKPATDPSAGFQNLDSSAIWTVQTGNVACLDYSLVETQESLIYNRCFILFFSRISWQAGNGTQIDTEFLEEPNGNCVAFNSCEFITAETSTPSPTPSESNSPKPSRTAVPTATPTAAVTRMPLPFATPSPTATSSRPEPLPILTDNSTEPPAVANITVNNYYYGPSCFPSRAQVVVVRNHQRVPIWIKDIQVGDWTQTSEHGDYSPVFMLGHNDAHAVSDYIEFELRCLSADCLGRLSAFRASPDHLLYVGAKLLPAHQVQIRDILAPAMQVMEIHRVRDIGLFNPHTLNGKIWVNGVQASCYTNIFSAKVAHGILIPMRFLFRAFGWDFDMDRSRTVSGLKSMYAWNLVFPITALFPLLW